MKMMIEDENEKREIWKKEKAKAKEQRFTDIWRCSGPSRDVSR